MDNINDIRCLLSSLRSEGNREGMGRYSINIQNALGIKVTDLRKFTRHIKKGGEAARALRGSCVHEARILATIVDDTMSVNGEQMERWANDFDSWNIVDQAATTCSEKPPWRTSSPLSGTAGEKSL